MEFVGIGDLHLTGIDGKGGLSDYVPDHDAMVVAEVERVKAYARKKHVQHVIQYGDVCESPRASYRALLALLDMVSEDDLTWTFILGNHDKFAKESAAGHSLEVLQRLRLPNVRIVTEPKLLKVGSTKVNFMPWPCSEFSREYLNVAHVDVDGATGDNGHPSRHKVRVKHRGKSVIGHIHTNQVVGGAHYSGTLYQTNFGEKPGKFFHHAQHEGGDWDIESVPHKPQYELITLDVASRKDLRAVENDPNKLYKLRLLKASNITPADYTSNVVRIQPVGKDGEQAAEELGEIATAGSEVSLDPDEFFGAWLDRQTLKPEVKDRVAKLRKQMLNRHKETSE